ncbi:MAG: restriction endonuclease subunit S, partial [Segatella copri]
LAATEEMVKSRFIEMFGECPRKEKLSSLCETFIDGDWIESKDQSEDGIRLVQTGNVGYGYFKDKEDKSRYISEETFNRLHCTEIFAGDILVSRLPDPIGRACIIPEGIGRMITAVDCSIIRLKDVILPEYFISYTMTSTYSAQINEVTTGTTRRRVSRANLGNVLVPCPSLEAQRQFVAISQQADKSKFVGFKSRFIEMFAGKYQTKPLSDFIESSFPGEWGTDDANNTGTKVIRTTNFTNEGRIDYTNVVTRQIDANKIKKKKLQHGDIILERSGGTNENPVGRVVLFNEDGTYIFNNFTQLLRPIEDVNNIYLFYSLFNYYHLNKHQIRSMGAKTTGIQNLNMELYMKNPIYDAPMDVQDSFATIFEQADKSKYYYQIA